MREQARRIHGSGPCQASRRDKRTTRLQSAVRAYSRRLTAEHFCRRSFLGQRFVAVDCETTGLVAGEDRVIEVAWAVFDGNKCVEERACLLALERRLPSHITTLTGLHPVAFEGAPPFADVAPELLSALASADFVVAYNAPFDRAFLADAFARVGLALPRAPWLDPLVLARALNRIPGARMNLRATCARHGVVTRTVHRALNDAKAAAALLFCLGRKLAALRGTPPSLDEILALQAAWRVRQVRGPSFL